MWYLLWLHSILHQKQATSCGICYGYIVYYTRNKLRHVVFVMVTLHITLETSYVMWYLLWLHCILH